MAWINTRGTRLSQPQGPVGIDWSNPHTKNLYTAWNGTTPGYYMSGGVLRPVGWVGTQGGRSGKYTAQGVSFNSANSQFIDLGSFPTFTELTTLLIAESSAVNSFSVSCRSSSATGGFDAALFGNGGAAGVNQALRVGGNAGGSDNANATSGANDGKLHSYIGAWKGGDPLSSWFDGVSLSGTAGLGAVSVTPSQNVYLARRAATYWSGFIGLFLAWTVRKSEADALDLADNPWQLFKPVNRRLYFDVGGGASSYILDAQPGAFTFGGQPASLLATRAIDAQPGAFALTGQNAALLTSRALDAQPGSFVIAGQPATFTHTTPTGYTLNAEAGSFAIGGQYAGLTTSRILDAQPGAFLVSGQDAALNAQRLLDAQPGTFTVTGQDATLTYGGTAPSIDAQPGAFVVTGFDAALTVSRRLVADPGAFVLTGMDAYFGPSVIATRSPYIAYVPAVPHLALVPAVQSTAIRGL